MQPGPVWVITGASRGIGAEFIKQILANEQAVVIAGARSPESSKELQELHELHSERLHLVSLDVASTSSIQAAVKLVTALPGITSIDYLINNAGRSDPCQSRSETAESLRQTLEVHVVGVHTMIQAFLPLLQAGHKKTVVNISSSFASLSARYDQYAKRKEEPSIMTSVSLGYKTSKAALNMLTLRRASDVTPEEGFTFVAIHPGSVETDMNNATFGAWKLPKKIYDLRLTPTDSVKQVLGVIAKLTPQDSGRYLNFDGNTFPC